MPLPEQGEVVIPHPDLPVVICTFSVNSEGKISADGGPGMPGQGRINGYIENILRTIAPQAVSLLGFSPEWGEGAIEMGLTARSGHRFAEVAKKFGSYERLVYSIAPEVIEEQAQLFEKSGVKRVAIPVDEKRKDELLSLLKPDTKYEIVPRPGGFLKMVIIEL